MTKAKAKTPGEIIAAYQGLIASVCDVQNISPAPDGGDLQDLRFKAVANWVQNLRIERNKHLEMKKDLQKH